MLLVLSGRQAADRFSETLLPLGGTRQRVRSTNPEGNNEY